MNRWVIVGGGFRGIIGAHFLAKAGFPVTIVERNSFLGGVMQSQNWNGFYLDYGCHLFDNAKDDTTEVLLEIMDGDVIPVDVHYASVTEGVKSDGVAIPDYTFLDRTTQQQNMFEVIEAATKSPSENGTLADLLYERFGPALRERLASAGRKMLGVEPDQLEAAAIESTPFGRIRVVPDDMAMLLKNNPLLDNRFAVSSQDDPLKFYRQQATKYPYRNFYPNEHGMGGFCERALDHLQGLGVNIKFQESVRSISKNGGRLRLDLSGGQELEADRVLWATEAGELSQLLLDENPLEQLVHKVSMAVFYFKCPREQVGDYTYVHDFSENSRIFRASAPGVYSQQIDADGNTYVCFEVPTKKGSELWDEPDGRLGEVWQEASILGVVHGEQPRDNTVLRLPATFRVPKLGFGNTKDAILARVHSFSDRIFVAQQTAFSKIDIIEHLKEIPAF